MKLRTSSNRANWAVAGLAVCIVSLSAAVAPAQQTEELFSRQTSPIYGPKQSTTPPSFGKQNIDPKPQNPYGLKNAHQTVDKSDIETFVTQIAGAGKGPVPESERERIISQFERQYNVYLHDRDLLITSEMNAKELVNALDNSVNQSNTTSQDNQLEFEVRRGLPKRTVRGQEFRDLEPYNKQAYLNSLRFGNIPKGVRLPGLTNSNGAYGNADLGGNYFDPSGNQKTVGLTGDYQSRLTRSPYGGNPPAQNSYPQSFEDARAAVADQKLVNRSGLPTELFRKLERDPQLPAAGSAILRSIDNQAKEFYSNGQPRFDDRGNEIYPNGARKFDDRGTPLYSNGQPKVDSQGNRLHSNGRRMVSDDGRELYPNGRPRETQTGSKLFQDGARKWTAGGQDPADFAKKYNQTVPGDDVDLGAEPLARQRTSTISPREALSGQSVDSNAEQKQRQLQRQSSPLYQNGRQAMTTDGVKLHPNGTARFSGDGLGSVEEPPLPKGSGAGIEGRQAGFVQPLYPSGREAFTQDGTRMYSNGVPRSDNRGQPLYANGQTLAADGGQALTPTGDRVVATRGYQARPQGTFDLFRIYDGSIVELDGEKLVIQLRGKAETMTFSIEEAKVSRDDRTQLLPGKLDQLSPKLNVQVIAQVEENFVDGRSVGIAEIGKAVSIIATNPRVGRQIEDGMYTVTYPITGTTRRLAADRISIAPARGPVGIDVFFDDETLLQKQQRSGMFPAPIQTIGMGRRVDMIVEQQITIQNGRIQSTGPQRALAVIQK